MASTNTDAVKILFKPTGNNDEPDVIAVSVVIRIRDVEQAIERSRESLKLDKTLWKVQRVIEAQDGA